MRGHPQEGPPSGGDTHSRGSPLFQEGTPPPQDGPLSHEGPLSSFRRPSQPPQTSSAALRSPPAAASLRPCPSLLPPPPPPLRAQGERRGRGQGVVRGGEGGRPRPLRQPAAGATGTRSPRSPCPRRANAGSRLQVPACRAAGECPWLAEWPLPSPQRNRGREGAAGPGGHGLPPPALPLKKEL